MLSSLLAPHLGQVRVDRRTTDDARSMMRGLTLQFTRGRRRAKPAIASRVPRNAKGATASKRQDGWRESSICSFGKGKSVQQITRALVNVEARQGEIARVGADVVTGQTGGGQARLNLRCSESVAKKG